jgi:hypothetical protein
MCGFLLALIEQERPMGFICISPIIAQKFVVSLSFSLFSLESFPHSSYVPVVAATTTNKNYRKSFK